MSKRPTKKAEKWVPKVGDKVSMRGTVMSIYPSGNVAVLVEGDYPANMIVLPSSLRPAVELFAWSPKEKPTPKGAKKK